MFDHLDTTSGLILPPRLQREQRTATENGREVTVGRDRVVRTRHVQLGRRGWRHEVNATWPERDDAGEPAIVSDNLWLTSEDDAQQLARAAAAELRAGAIAGGLSGLARRLQLDVD